MFENLNFARYKFSSITWLSICRVLDHKNARFRRANCDLQSIGGTYMINGRTLFRYNKNDIIFPFLLFHLESFLILNATMKNKIKKRNANYKTILKRKKKNNNKNEEYKVYERRRRYCINLCYGLALATQGFVEFQWFLKEWADFSSSYPENFESNQFWAEKIDLTIKRQSQNSNNPQ